jgi:hypothetical protein
MIRNIKISSKSKYEYNYEHMITKGPSFLTKNQGRFPCKFIIVVTTVPQVMEPLEGLNACGWYGPNIRFL